MAVVTAVVLVGAAIAVVLVRGGGGQHAGESLPTLPPGTTSTAPPPSAGPTTSAEPTVVSHAPASSAPNDAAGTPPVSTGTAPPSGGTTGPATTAPAAPPYALVVTEHWFHPALGGLYEYGGIIENTGAQAATGYIAIEVDFFDADDRLLATKTAFADMVVPGSRTPFPSVLVDVAVAPARMEARVSSGTFIDEEPGPQGTVETGDVSLRRDGDFLDVTGEAASSFSVDLDYVVLVAAWRGADGSVEFSATGFIERLPAGSVATFAISTFGDDLPSTSPTEILVAP